ncbi:MAG: pitrilysin family protein [Desulfobacterales bacterium]
MEPIQKTTLANGVRLLTKHIPHTRSVSMGIWVAVGARDESDPESGMAHFIEHMLFKGTRKRTGYQIAKAFDAIGGYTNAFTSMESTCYHAKVMDSRLDVMVDILADIFLNSLFADTEIEKERPVIMQEISMMEDSPEDYIHILSTNAFWKNNPLGRSVLGTRENIHRFDAAMTRRFFSSYYQPERIVISAAGNVNHNRFVDLLGNDFESIAPQNGFPERVTPEGIAGVSISVKELEQIHISLNTKGVPVADSSRYALSLINTILGGNMSSRLFQQIREREGLAYSVYSYASSYEDTGLFGSYAATDPKDAERAVKMIVDAMGQIKTSTVEPSELADAKEFTKGSLVLASENIDNQMVRLARNEIHFGRNIALEEVLNAIDAVTQADIQRLSRTIFDNKYLSMTLLGPVKNPLAFESLLNI